MRKTKKGWWLPVTMGLTIGMISCEAEKEDTGTDVEEPITYILSIAADQTALIEGSDEEVEITVSMDQSNQSGEAIAVALTLRGNAIEGEDYETVANEVSIADGDESVSFELKLIDDEAVEEVEQIEIMISTQAANVEVSNDNKVTLVLTDTDEEDPNGSTDNDISILASKFYHTDAVTVTYDEDWVTITTKDLPDHKSMYYGANDPLYEAYREPNNPDFKKNPGSIGEQNIVFKLPRYPEEATNKESPGLGPMGVAINSVVFFNQGAAPGDDIFEEVNTFDQYEGHPAGDQYHYHIEPVWLTELKGSDAFMGFLLDGFPVYGTVENGEEITNDDLDDYHGHFGVTADFPNGIYHYHITEEYPWINGDGYYGVVGSKTQ